MFVLADIKEYWCIVARDDQLHSTRILKQSDDLKNSEFEIDDYNLDYSIVEWQHSNKQCAGVFKLYLEPVYEEPEEDEKPSEKIFDCLTVVSFEILYEI